MVHPVRNILNRLRWDEKENPEDYIITYRHRGAPGDAKQINASKIRTLGKSYFIIQEDSTGEESLIPFHRILEIRNMRDDSILWVSRKTKP
jgi:uncharacterized protein (UPF0248 family)